MTGIVDVGGGMRGIYTAGIYDYFLDHGVTVDYCLGVSAGSANLASYLAGQRGRNRRFYIEYAKRPEYMSLSNLLHTGSYVGMDYIYSTLSNSDGEDPVDYDTLAASASQYIVVATDAVTGQAHYFTRADLSRDCYDILKASCCLPMACQPYPVGDSVYFDGGVADPVPYQKALDDGCDRLVVLLTRPRDFVRPPLSNLPAAKLALHHYPHALEALQQRHIKYNQAVQAVKQLEAEGRALLLAPADIDGISTLHRNEMAMERLYGYGYQDGEKAAAFLA